MATIPYDRGLVSANVQSVQTLNSSPTIERTIFGSASSNTVTLDYSLDFTVVGNRTIQSIGTFVATANSAARLATLTGGGGGGGTTSTPTQSWYLS